MTGAWAVGEVGLLQSQPVPARDAIRNGAGAWDVRELIAPAGLACLSSQNSRE